jgi:hypothetical protein
VRREHIIAWRNGIWNEVMKGASPKIINRKSLAETNQRNLQTLWGNQAAGAWGWYFIVSFEVQAAASPYLSRRGKAATARNA